MANVEECRAALRGLAARLAEMDPQARDRHTIDRTLDCRVRDLGVVFSARLRNGRLEDIHDHPQEDAGPAQVRFTVNSDDLLALVDGRLSFAGAWATGRMKIEASVMDLLRLRRLL
ncbi:MAG: hypothetical protein GEV03_27470 [Streptosporangiales bacterium]|nr:hypothetical protein [Streptosporangiales bacterium]